MYESTLNTLCVAEKLSLGDVSLNWSPDGITYTKGGTTGTINSLQDCEGVIPHDADKSKLVQAGLGPLLTLAPAEKYNLEQTWLSLQEKCNLKDAKVVKLDSYTVKYNAITDSLIILHDRASMVWTVGSDCYCIMGAKDASLLVAPVAWKLGVTAMNINRALFARVLDVVQTGNPHGLKDGTVISSDGEVLKMVSPSGKHAEFSNMNYTDLLQKSKLFWGAIMQSVANVYGELHLTDDETFAELDRVWTRSDTVDHKTNLLKGNDWTLYFSGKTCAYSSTKPLEQILPEIQGLAPKSDNTVELLEQYMSKLDDRVYKTEMFRLLLLAYPDVSDRIDVMLCESKVAQDYIDKLTEVYGDVQRLNNVLNDIM